MRKRYSFDEIMRMDAVLLQMAIYETSQGKIFIPKSPEELMEFQIKSSGIFNYFKNLIRTGEITFDELQSQVAEKWGPLQQETSGEVDIDKMLSDMDKENAEQESEKKALNHIANMLRSIFSDSSPPIMAEATEDSGDQVTEIKRIGNPFTIPNESIIVAEKKEAIEPEVRYNEIDAKPKKQRKQGKAKKSKTND